MQQKKIPIINDTFDPITFFNLLKKSLWIILLIIGLSIVGSLLKIRYTSPLYEAKTIIQLSEENQTSKVLQIDNIYEDNKKLSKTIALLRSKEFLKKAFSRLPLNIRYFVQGAFLSDEYYKNSPYKIKYRIKNSALYGVPIYIYFDDNQTYTIKYSLNDKTVKQTGNVNTWNKYDNIDIKPIIENFETIKNMYANEKQNEYFFKIYNNSQIYAEHKNTLNITILNRNSNTLQIICKNNNASQAADITNTIAAEFQRFDIEKKKAGIKNILNFINVQLKNVYHALDTTENKLQKFKKQNNIPNENIIKNPFPILTSKVEEFNEQITKLDFEILTLKNIKKQISEQENLNIYELLAMMAGTRSQDILSKILSNLQHLIDKRATLLNDVTSNNLQIKVIDKQIENQRGLIEDFINNNINRLSEKKTEYTKRQKEYEQKMFSGDSYNKLEYARLMRLRSINEGFYNQLIQKKAEYLISEAGYVSKTVILEVANSNLPSISPNKNQIILIGIILGIIISLLFIFIRYLMFNEITSISTIESYTKAPIIGMIPIY